MFLEKGQKRPIKSKIFKLCRYTYPTVMYLLIRKHHVKH